MDPVYNDLEVEILDFNNSKQLAKSIDRIHQVLKSRLASAHDRSFAYVLKSNTYKRVYNYATSLRNLEVADSLYRAAELDNPSLELRILVEKFFVYFDLRKTEQRDSMLSEIRNKDLGPLDERTRGTYITALGILSLGDKNYDEAHIFLDDAIRILKANYPQDLPNVYRVKVKLYSDLQKPELAINAYKQGIFYAEKYNIDIYRIIMYETMVKYYLEQKDYVKMTHFQQKINISRTDYNANNVSGELSLLEADLARTEFVYQEERERREELFMVLSLSALFLVLVLSIVFSCRMYRKKREMQKQNTFFRSEIDRLTSELDTYAHGGESGYAGYGFSERQLAVIDLVKEGKTNKQIAEQLFISENTVKYHLKAIYEKLGVKNRLELR